MKHLGLRDWPIGLPGCGAGKEVLGVLAPMVLGSLDTEGTVGKGPVEETGLITVEDVPGLVLLGEVWEAGHPVVHSGLGHS